MPNPRQIRPAFFDDFNYPAQFPLARNLKRTIQFHLGPTNSGKTHDALQALAKAASGVYLAPLRLLAMEVRDRLLEMGVPCNLITGEERQFIEGAQHTACTVEMMHPQQVVDVAIIDEIQMLQDEARGWAWTMALVGVPAKTVYVCGSEAVTQPCVRLVEAMGERYEIKRLQRKTPLLVESDSLTGERYSKHRLKGKLHKGDAIIAFTRKDVLTLSARFRQWGWGVASIYGALSPEVRRTEARRFNSGEAEILVATDAIGMGLNLPIRRVIFSSAHKFDGQASRLLNATEVRQIAGRAGRYGIYPEGYVSAFEDDDLRHITHMLETSDTAEMDKLPVSFGRLEAKWLADSMHTNRLAQVLTYVAERMKLQQAHFTIAPMGVQIALAQLIDEAAPHMHLNDKYIFSSAPVSVESSHEVDYFVSCLKAHYHNQRKLLRLPAVWLSGISPKYLEEAELLSKDISLYAWLSFKYPHTFTEADKIGALRAQVSRYIEQALLIQAGYKETSKEQFLQQHCW